MYLVIECIFRRIKLLNGTIIFMTHMQRTLENEIRGCQKLVIWTDCDREGENIGFEVIQVCRAGHFLPLAIKLMMCSISH